MTTPIPSSLGRRVADCRDRLGWTQKTLAEKAGLSVTFVSEIENDRRAPGTEALLSIANALGASLDYIVKGVSDTPPMKRPLVLPSELAEAAEEGGWSVGVAGDLLKFHQMVFARRRRTAAGDDLDRELDKNDWTELYQAYLRFFGAEGDASTSG